MEPKPIYEPAAQVHERKLINRRAAVENAQAALEWLKALQLYANCLMTTAQRSDDDHALSVAYQEARGLNLATAALAAGLDKPMGAA